MAEVFGIVLFALIILLSVCLHEAGHMVTAKSFGMKVTRYFAGFGPTLWSFKRGETEYGVKAIPLGGFVKIVGMTPQDDDVTPEDEHRAMWRFPVWKRTIVMSAGSATHFVIGFVLLWVTFAFVGMPNPVLTKIYENPSAATPYIQVISCVNVSSASRPCVAGTDPAGPAQQAGLRDGDQITAVGGVPVATYGELVTKIRSTPPGPVTVTYIRAGQTSTVTVNLVAAQRAPIDDPDGPVSTVSAIGVGPTTPPGVPLNVAYGPIDGFGEAVGYTGQTFGAIWSSIGNLPGKVPGLFRALAGEPRDPEGPISVVGASELGGQTVSIGAWNFFLLLAAGLNFFVGVFNLLPLLPLDGGHIAIAWYERVRSWLARKRNKPDPGRVDYMKLMPITYVVIIIFGGFSVLTILADIINPVNLLGK